MMRLDLELAESIGSAAVAAKYVSDPSSLCLLATIYEKPVGYVCCTSDAYAYQIVDMLVVEDLRQIGLGSCLLGTVKMYVWPHHSIEAQVDVRDKGSLEFLMKNGFEAVGVKEDMVTMRCGCRFRKAPPVQFRGVKNGY